MKKPYAFILVVSSFLLLAFHGCQDEGSSEFSSEVEFYKYHELTNIYENEIIPLGSSFTHEAERLLTAARSFQTNPTTENLLVAQDQWKSVQLVWKQLELYDIGPVADSFIYFEINRWPTDTVRIEDNINSSSLIDTEYIVSLGSSSKGLAGLEYLLFPQISADSLDTFTTSENAMRRMDYLVALSENLLIKSKQLSDLWKASGPLFTSSLENGISGSQNQVINAMVTLIEEIIISKLGNPLGDSNGGMIEPDRLEAHRSNYSKEIIQQHLIATHRCYRGDFAMTPFRVGFDDFLVLIGSESLSLRIEAQFSDCQDKLDAIEGSIEDEIVTHPEGVIDLKNSFRDLLVLLKVDMANVLGSTITFNDNDGD